MVRGNPGTKENGIRAGLSHEFEPRVQQEATGELSSSGFERFLDKVEAGGPMESSGHDSRHSGEQVGAPRQLTLGFVKSNMAIFWTGVLRLPKCKKKLKSEANTNEKSRHTWWVSLWRPYFYCVDAGWGSIRWTKLWALRVAQAVCG